MKRIRIFCMVFLIFILVMPSGRGAVAAQELGKEGYVKSSHYNPNPAEAYDIIGDDSRVPVADTYAYPYSAVARLRVIKKCGCYSEGSGFMVSRNCMLTAGHVLHCAEHKKGVKSITANFGQKDDVSCLLMYSTTADDAIIYYNPKYINSNEYDYGYIVYDANIGETTGWYGLLGRSSTLAAAIAADGALIESKIAVAGYVNTTLYYGEGKVNGTVFPRVQYDVDTMKGESGGPVTFANESGYAFAIHTSGPYSDIKYNSGWRITQEFIETLASHGYIEITK